MKKYNVLIADKALRDMEAIYQHIALELLSPETAIRQYNRIADFILSLETMPDLLGYVHVPKYAEIDNQPERLFQISLGTDCGVIHSQLEVFFAERIN
jgi:hypothetical protein